ncbi:MAG: IscS subfamily cysteine desulfurase [Chitinophagales bacterium]|nr:IscS subfamily cysteine desulfurase [Chitinophagales bacterium]
MKLPIYLDNSATTPVDPRVLEVMLPYYTEKFGNAASRTHAFGWIGEEAVDHARERCARLINASPTEIIFTSGSTESNNLALKGVFEMFASKGNHIITVVTEHKSVLDACKHLEKYGANITYLQVDKKGRIDIKELENAITDKTILVSIMYGNNEIGILQPVKEISEVARKHHVLFHTDATQAAGKINIDVEADGIDLLSFSAHKIYGPKGVGALYVRRRNPRVRITAQIDGGGHERGMRSGTLNVPGIAGFGMASEICANEMLAEAAYQQKMRDKLEKELLKQEEVYVNGDTERRLPHITNLSFKHVESESLMIALSKNIAVASGSACTSASLEPSYVLKALGLSNELAYSSIRFSVGRFNTEEEVNYAIQYVTESVKKIRERSSLWETHKKDIIIREIEEVRK